MLTNDVKKWYTYKVLNKKKHIKKYKCLICKLVKQTT